MNQNEHKRRIPQKIQMLKFIADQGIVCIEDLNRHFYPDRDNSKAIRVTLYDMGVAHLRYYSPTVKNGVWYINDPDHYQLLDAYFSEYSYFKVSEPLVHLIPHCLELNHIRTVIEQDVGLDIKRWYSEGWLRSLPASLRQYYASPRIPDAIFITQRKDGSERKFFLEYERSLKNSERYIEIFSSYAKQEDVKARSVIFICQTDHILNKLKSIEKRQYQIGRLDDRYFQFLGLEYFYENYSEKRAKRMSQLEQEKSVPQEVKEVEEQAVS